MKRAHTPSSAAVLVLALAVLVAAGGAGTAAPRSRKRRPSRRPAVAMPARRASSSRSS